MGYRDLEQRRLDRRLQERWSRMRWVALIAVLGYVIIFLYILGYTPTLFPLFPQENVPAQPRNELALTFEFSREPITRNFAIDVTPSPSSQAQPSPTAISVRLASDLRREDGPGEFPASQVTVGINRLTSTLVNLTVTADPWTPEKVPGGLYEGVLELRGSGPTRELPMSIWLRSRENGAAAIAMSILLAGAILGLLVKWITERLTPQAALIRRLSTLKRAIGYREDSSTLPVSVRLRVQDLEDQIARQDYTGVEASFKRFEEDKERLALVASQFQVLLDQLAGQSRLLERAKGVRYRDRILIEGVLDSEYRELQEMLAFPWSDEGQTQLLSSARRFRPLFATIHGAILSFLDREPRSEELRKALTHFQAGEFEEGETAYRAWLDLPDISMTQEESAHEAAVSSEPTTVMPIVSIFRYGLGRPTLREGERVGFLFRQARSIAGAASVLVVSLVGLKTQYLDDQAFDGALTSWLALGLWGTIVELSGVSVLDVLGRLGTSGSTAPSSRA
jgi:hypothetical protein